MSLEDIQLRVGAKMAELKIDEKVRESREALSRTWVSGSSRVRGAVGQAWAGLDSYRGKKGGEVGEARTEVVGTDAKDQTKTDGKGEAGTGKKESFVGSWTAWAAEKRKRAFMKEEPVKIERVDIGPAPARPLAQWAKRSSETSSTGVPTPRLGESVRSSGETSETRVQEGEANGKTSLEEVKLG